MRYIEGLNGVRAIAALLVIFFHWPYPMLTLPFGWVGVQLFFVLSGFLITRILLETKQPFSLKDYLQHFYIKRSLRIFPLYFGFLLIISILWLSQFFIANATWQQLIAIELNDFANNGWAMWTYCYNFILPQSGYFTHLWSLAVEEQFYLVFPFLIYFLTMPQLKVGLIAILIGVSISRTVVVPLLLQEGWETQAVASILYRYTFFQIDALCWGSVLAVWNFDRIRRPLLSLLAIGIFTIMVGQLHQPAWSWRTLGYEFPEHYVESYRYLYSYTLINLCAMFFLLCVLRGYFQCFLCQPIMDYLGKISYGLYLYHVPIGFALLKTAHLFIAPIDIVKQPLLEFMLFCGIFMMILLIAHFSFYYYESYFLKLKKRW